jgi:hypothetical protein
MWIRLIRLKLRIKSQWLMIFINYQIKTKISLTIQIIAK